MHETEMLHANMYESTGADVLHAFYDQPVVRYEVLARQPVPERGQQDAHK